MSDDADLVAKCIPLDDLEALAALKRLEEKADAWDALDAYDADYKQKFHEREAAEEKKLYTEIGEMEYGGEG